MKQNANWIIFVVWQREGLELSFHKLVKLSGLEKLWERHGAKTHKGKKKKFCYSKVWQMFTFTNGDFILSLKNDATIKTGGKDKRGIFVKTNRDNRSKLANDEVWQLKIHLVSTEFSLQTFFKACLFKVEMDVVTPYSSHIPSIFTRKTTDFSICKKALDFMDITIYRPSRCFMKNEHFRPVL